MSYPIQILRQLGAGGNGDIYIGQRLDTREFVVVKYNICASTISRMLGRLSNGRCASFNESCAASFP